MRHNLGRQNHFAFGVMALATITETCRELGLSRASIYRWIRDGWLKNYVLKDEDGRTYINLNPSNRPDLLSHIKGFATDRPNSVVFKK